MKTLIVIGGATASGKTDLAIDLALHFNTQILSADSRQCYRELNIGVAKPDIEQLKSVEHFFINSHSIHDHVSAGEYEKYALEVLEKIFIKNDYAVCVGGTGLYINALCNGMDEMPQVDKRIEQDVQKQYEQMGLVWLQKEIQKEDLDFWQQAEKENPHRLMRALVFKLSTGSSILSFRKNENKPRSFDVKYFALDIEREMLYNRINIRVDDMIGLGLIEEVKSLIPFQHLKPLQTVGYTELFSWLNDECTLDFAIEKIKQHTRNYAKRQITWFKHQNEYLWIQPNYQNIIERLRL